MSDWSDFGAHLRDTRSTFGWSVEDVAHRTRIPASTLRQLEANDYSKFPSTSYTKSFLVQYSEHLGIDAADWLDNFETGDALANLDSYEYLKDHDEHVDAAPLALKRSKPKALKTPPKKVRRSPRSSSLQPLLVFLVTAGMITGVVFGFMKLSSQFADDSADADPAPSREETLRPLTGINESRSNVRDLSNVPRALPVPGPVIVPEPSENNLFAGDPRNLLRPELGAVPPDAEGRLPSELPIATPPPRAVIVEE